MTAMTTVATMGNVLPTRLAAPRLLRSFRSIVLASIPTQNHVKAGMTKPNTIHLVVNSAIPIDLISLLDALHRHCMSGPKGCLQRKDLNIQLSIFLVMANNLLDQERTSRESLEELLSRNHDLRSARKWPPAIPLTRRNGVAILVLWTATVIGVSLFIEALRHSSNIRGLELKSTEYGQSICNSLSLQNHR